MAQAAVQVGGCTPSAQPSPSSWSMGRPLNDSHPWLNNVQVLSLSRAPDHHGRRISHTSETLFAFAQAGFGAPLALGNIIDAQQDLLHAARVDGR